MNLITIAIAFLIGVLGWTLLEYCIHRWLGHDKRTMPNGFATEHVRHHSEGDYFAPAWKKAGGAAALFVVVGLPVVWWLGSAVGGAFAAGLVLCYLGYEVLHRLEHVDGGRTAYGRWARRHHFHHHFHNPKANHGVTTPLWDMVFGTLERPATPIRVPEKLQMGWLVDGTTGEVRPEHSGSYALRRRKSRSASDAGQEQAEAAEGPDRAQAA